MLKAEFSKRVNTSDAHQKTPLLGREREPTSVELNKINQESSYKHRRIVKILERSRRIVKLLCSEYATSFEAEKRGGVCRDKRFANRPQLFPDIEFSSCAVNIYRTSLVHVARIGQADRRHSRALIFLEKPKSGIFAWILKFARGQRQD